MLPARWNQSYWAIVIRQFRKNKPALAGFVLLIVLGLVAIFAPFLAHDVPIYLDMNGTTYWFPNVISYRDLVSITWKEWQPGPNDYAIRPPIPYSPLAQNLLGRLEAPSRDHLLGTDDRGRDVAARLIWGARISMGIGFVAVGISLVIGLILGALAGFYGGWVDSLVLRFIEIMMCFPTFFLILALVAMLNPSIWNIMIVLGVTGWTGIARLVRGEFLRLRNSDMATAARATGLRDWRIIFRHLLPNSLAPVFVSATFGVGGAILTESALSFLGFGVQPPTASWGETLKQSQRFVDLATWLVVAPGVAIFVTVTAFNLVGDGLRDAMDPRLRD